MVTFRALALLAVSVMYLIGCAAQQPTGERGGSLVGAWLVTASRPAGVGKNLLTFSSDGTFFRSGDTHPTLSGAHGTWKRAPDGGYDATYIAFRFDQSGKWIGSTKTRIHVAPSTNPNEFTGLAKVSTRDLADNEVATSETRLEGKRIQVEPI
jgi:hypothetical protein